MAVSVQEEPGFLKRTFPVDFPFHAALTYNAADFETYLEKNVVKLRLVWSQQDHNSENDVTYTTTLVEDSAASTTTTGEVARALKDTDLGPQDDLPVTSQQDSEQHPFMKALYSSNTPTDRNMQNMMATENGDLAYRSTTEPLVDLFSELEDVVSGPRLLELLDAAWLKDPLSTLKIIFNARSIHLGKSARSITYRCFGWLAQKHPLTLLANLQWLTRPVIDKKMGVKAPDKDEDEMVMVEAENDEDDPTRFNVQNGVAHGYWKDLLNILALAVDGKLHVSANPRDLLNIENKRTKKNRVWDSARAKEVRNDREKARHETAIKMFNEQSFYRALHLTIARLFAEQLKSDLALLRTNDKKATRRISLCAKWAPSTGLFHDKHTFVVSSIAEIMHPQEEFPTISSREIYLRYAREAYRKDVSALRKQIEVVEVDICAKQFGNIKYDHVPSLAMNQYAGLFATKDSERFDRYITGVAEGKQSISGATLLPSVLISKVRSGEPRVVSVAGKGAKAMVDAKMANIDAKVADGQWNTLVKRIKESGRLQNSIAVADVSGSMLHPRFNDGSTPMDSSIGLSLLLAEVTAPPFGGSCITFSSNPQIHKIKGTTLQEKIADLQFMEWGMSTDFVAVFDKLILPMAREHKLKQDDMVKQIFVFSDMQFDAALSGSPFTTSYERIKKDFELYGYEMPKLIFWNLAGGRAGVTGNGDPIAPKPVTADEEGTALVSGYSQGMLKVFLDNGSFEDPEAEEEITEEEVEGEDGETTVQVTKKVKMDPLSTVRKAISHKAYAMLRVVD